MLCNCILSENWVKACVIVKFRLQRNVRDSAYICKLGKDYVTHWHESLIFFFLMKFAKFWHIIRISTTNCRKQSGFHGPPCTLACFCLSVYILDILSSLCRSCVCYWCGPLWSDANELIDWVIDAIVIINWQTCLFGLVNERSILHKRCSLWRMGIKNELQWSGVENVNLQKLHFVTVHLGK